MPPWSISWSWRDTMGEQPKSPSPLRLPGGFVVRAVTVLPVLATMIASLALMI